MDEKRRLSRWLAENGTFADERFPGIPVVEIAGTGRVLVERHQGVRAYSAEQVEISLCYGILCVSGENLVLTQMTRGQLVICGRIHCLQIRRGCG